MFLSLFFFPSLDSIHVNCLPVAFINGCKTCHSSEKEHYNSFNADAASFSKEKKVLKFNLEILIMFKLIVNNGHVFPLSDSHSFSALALFRNICPTSEKY